MNKVCIAAYFYTKIVVFYRNKLNITSFFRGLGRDPEAMWEEIYSTIAEVCFTPHEENVSCKEHHWRILQSADLPDFNLLTPLVPVQESVDISYWLIQRIPSESMLRHRSLLTQCYGSGSVSQRYGSGFGSGFGSGSFHHPAKIVRKTMYEFLSLKNDVNLPSKSSKQNTCCWHLEGHWRKEQDSDPLVRGTDPRIRIRSKMSWVRNTDLQYWRMIVWPESAWW